MKNEEKGYRYHATIEVDMNLKEGETLSQARQRMKKELKKTNVNCIYVKDDSLREFWVMHCGKELW